MSVKVKYLLALFAFAAPASAQTLRPIVDPELCRPPLPEHRLLCCAALNRNEWPFDLRRYLPENKECPTLTAEAIERVRLLVPRVPGARFPASDPTRTTDAQEPVSRAPEGSQEIDVPSDTGAPETSPADPRGANEPTAQDAGCGSDATLRPCAPASGGDGTSAPRDDGSSAPSEEPETTNPVDADPSDGGPAPRPDIDKVSPPTVAPSDNDATGDGGEEMGDEPTPQDDGSLGGSGRPETEQPSPDEAPVSCEETPETCELDGAEVPRNAPGNPGNDRAVGGAGEAPNDRDFGKGERGRSDATGKGGTRNEDADDGGSEEGDDDRPDRDRRGNPGNDRPNGSAGESPGGGDFGNGSRGRSDTRRGMSED